MGCRDDKKHKIAPNYRFIRFGAAVIGWQYGWVGDVFEDRKGGIWVPKRTQEEVHQDKILGFLVEVMEGKPTEKGQLRAAELLAKYYGMFEKREDNAEEKPVAFVGDEKLGD